MRIISLFSGAGGLDLGLIQAGNDIVCFLLVPETEQR